MRILRAALAVLLTVWAATSAHASEAHADGHAHVVGNDAELVDGEVRKIDKEKRRLTLKHGPLKNLDMPGMTMVFQVGDTVMLDKLQPGDKIRFAADKVDGKITVIRMEAVH